MIKLKFNKLYESIFKPATDEEVRERKEQSRLPEFKRWVERELHIKYEDLYKPENINKKDNDGYTPIMATCYMGQLNILKQLLEAGADPNLKDKYNFTALSVAKVNNQGEIVKLLEQYGAKL